MAEDGSATLARQTSPKRWSGIQTCSGSDADSMQIATTSEEATVTNFVKSKTRVSISGIQVGPSAEYMCGPLNVEGVVTRYDNDSVDFRGDTEQSCTSPNGRTLLVGGFGGYDLDLRTERGVETGFWKLSFTLTLEEADDRDAGFYSYTHIVCRFELER